MDTDFEGINSVNDDSLCNDSVNTGSMCIDSVNTTGSVGVDSENTGSLNTDSMTADGSVDIDSVTAGSMGIDSVAAEFVGTDSVNDGSMNIDSMNAGSLGYGMDKKNLDAPNLNKRGLNGQSLNATNLNENGLNATNLNGHGLRDPDLKECVLNGQGSGHPDPKYVRTLDYLRRLCSMREYCRRDVYDKALKRLEDSEAARKAVDTLVAEKFVDEFRYASAFARDKASIRGWGPLKIRMALSNKGVPRDIIDNALAEIDSLKADDKLRKSLQTKARQLYGDPQLRLKLLRFALSRGHDYDTANSLVRELLSSEDEY